MSSYPTEEYDRSDKLESYQRIPSLEAIWLVSHREHLLEMFERQRDTTWRRSEARQSERLLIAALGATLAVDEIYSAVTPA